jgi:hypothetical protein
MVKFNTKNIIDPIDAIGELILSFGIKSHIVSTGVDTFGSRESTYKMYIQQLSPQSYQLEIHVPKINLGELGRLVSITEPGYIYTTENYTFKGYKLYDIEYATRRENKLVYTVTLEAYIERNTNGKSYK